jgi:hypothetical protein
MASPTNVRAYLAHWFQLGKPLVFEHQSTTCLPVPVFNQGEYSPTFEACWQQVERCDGKDCHLLGTDQSIAELLSPAWDIEACARCFLPVPLPVRTTALPLCPCSDMPQWPNDDVPLPRLAVNTQEHLGSIRDHLQHRHSPGHSPEAPLDQPRAAAPSAAAAPAGFEGVAPPMAEPCDRTHLQRLFQRSANLYPSVTPPNAVAPIPAPDPTPLAELPGEDYCP